MLERWRLYFTVLARKCSDLRVISIDNLFEIATPRQRDARSLMTLVEEASVFIGVGTSAQVHPAAGMLEVFGDVRLKYFVDPTPPSPSRLQGYHVIAGSACAILPTLVDELLGV